ncbi:hypothetical protein Mmc1_3391 [Magnetococcus marinus MC-1]|uniref:Uncharacterized protein n=1 Tax=Magnetococcus marinus (strain ATCC BAA-1437 / JCM 17883 / MC-1) TaxID=156889 RepID=A0L4S5_MAGMM|nr:hypothetical protein Mmc1_0443 [Magnetococcus marinus MC-1]ABK43393.1 hypothetical protein Mmc1_0874 [Magnetococcus marinus MC-1]ABK44012.1 hypothetical protein Mmc1_1503 [Magnetococcus marinus MC-1]ABK45877.1 hypothetical protein Mmc1_3391 [Magnetococcus marinus MC-1]
MAKNILDTIFVENVKFQKESAIRSVFAYQSLEESSGGFSAVAPTPGYERIFALDPMGRRSAKISSWKPVLSCVRGFIHRR